MDADGDYGPVEEAAVDTPITEDHGTPDNWVGVDPMRVARSYDPCLACTVHLYLGKRLLRKVDHNPIGCALE